eukprot:scaffold1220_cov376-Prasinococcus_capsulatus_cf.AAC.7
MIHRATNDLARCFAGRCAMTMWLLEHLRWAAQALHHSRNTAGKSASARTLENAAWCFHPSQMVTGARSSQRGPCRGSAACGARSAGVAG